jgi:hypothetical protein
VCERSRWLRPNWPDADIQQAMTTREVVLDGGSPWGFRLHGGADLNQPLRISRVSSVAALFLGFVYATITAAIVTITDAIVYPRCVPRPMGICFAFTRPPCSRHSINLDRNRSTYFHFHFSLRSSFESVRTT